MEILRVLPKSWISHFLGHLAHVRLPRPISKLLVGWFVRRYSVETKELAGGLGDYRSLGEFFVRELKPRSIGAEPVFPVDGTLRTFGPITEAFLEQVKGIRYSLDRLLEDALETDRFKGGYYLNLYLSPRDYHRVHSPITGSIRKMTYIPGALWPVNDWSIRAIPDLFTINERIVTYLSSPAGETAVVMVGATNVGKMSLSYDTLVTNRSPWRKAKSISRVYEPPLRTVNAGDHLGTFHLGSTVIVLFDARSAEHFAFDGLSDGDEAVYGRTVNPAL